MPEKNGDGMVFNCSDCNKNGVRIYAWGGNGSGSLCGDWGLSAKAIEYIHDHSEIYHRIQDMSDEIFNDNK